MTQSKMCTVVKSENTKMPNVDASKSGLNHKIAGKQVKDGPNNSSWNEQENPT